LELDKLLSDGMVLVKLGLRNPTGELVSENFYWLGADSESYRQLNRLAAASVSATASSSTLEGNIHVRVTLRNTGTIVSLVNKLTVLNAGDGSRILPAYFADNYVSLLPGESREIEIEFPATAARGAVRVAMRGWNLAGQAVSVTAKN
jgi:hypothetical protein